MACGPGATGPNAEGRRSDARIRSCERGHQVGVDGLDLLQQLHDRGDKQGGIVVSGMGGEPDEGTLLGGRPLRQAGGLRVAGRSGEQHQPRGRRSEQPVEQPRPVHELGAEGRPILSGTNSTRESRGRVPRCGRLQSRLPPSKPVGVCAAICQQPNRVGMPRVNVGIHSTRCLLSSISDDAGRFLGGVRLELQPGLGRASPEAHRASPSRRRSDRSPLSTWSAPRRRDDSASRRCRRGSP